MSGGKGWGIWAVGLALAALTAGARAQEPETGPLIAPHEMLAVEQVRPGMKGHGRSVFEGTRVESFGITVLGVLRKIDFGGDMILIRIDDGPPVSTGSGVSAGMSGSPIYVDGKLIGALAWTWPFARQPVAGVTPIAQMLENYRPGSAPPAPAVAGDLEPRGGPLALEGRLFSRATVVPEPGLAPPAGGGRLYLTPVATPILVSGMGRAGVEELKRRLGRFPALVAPGPGRVELPAAERPRLEPGAAVGVQLLGGDVDATGIGTVTYVRGPHVLAFGHPMFGLGSINMPMTTAFIHGVISSQEVSFKLGAPVETVGNVRQDRNWSIGGRTGETAPTVQAEFLVSDADRGVKRHYRVAAAVQRDLTPGLLYSSLLNAVGSVSPPTTGTTRGTVEVWASGLPVIRRENVFATGERRSQIEQLFGDPLAGLPMVELLQIMDVLENNTFGAVPLERVRVTVDVSEQRRTATIERAYADRKRVKPGDTVRIGVVLRPSTAPKETRELEVVIPRNIPGGRLLIGVAGGGSAERVRQYMQIVRPVARSLVQLVAQISDREQNSDLTIEMAQPVAGISVSGREFPNLPNVVVEVLTGANPSGIRMVRSHTRQTHATPWVLSGGQLLVLQVDADEKDKSGPAFTFGGSAPGGFSSLLDLFRLGAGADLGGDLEDAGDGGLLDGEEGGLFRLRAGARALAAPDEPAMPSFEELRRLLEGEGTGLEGEEATAVRSGLGRGPGVWRAGAAADFQGGTLEGVLVSSRGELALAPRSTSLLASPDRFFWAQATDAAGNVYVGGWLDGSIMKIDAAGRASSWFDRADEVAISALACAADGTVYAAAEPSGTIYRIAPDGKGAPLCRLPDRRVWALRRVGDALYAGTGSEGGLYRIAPDGAAALVFAAPDRHILALADDGRGTLYCGTYPRGKLFRVRDAAGSPRVEPVYELPGLTVTALALDAAGTLYAGTSPRATVVKITPAGDASVLFSAREKHVHSLLTDEAGNVYAATGGGARVYRIAPDRTVSTLWEPQAAYVLSLSRDSRGSLFATTAGPTQIVRLGGAPAERGTYTSAVLNAGHLARWGILRWSGPAGRIEVQTRTGSTAYPDATWSDWSAPYRNGAGERIASPPGQFLQYRVLLQEAAGAPAPTLRNLELFYRTRNRPPEVKVTRPAAGQVLSGIRPIRWTGKDPDGDRLSYDVYFAPENSDRWVKIGTRAAAPADGEEARAGGPPSRSAALRPAAPPGARRVALPPSGRVPISRAKAAAFRPRPADARVPGVPSAPATPAEAAAALAAALDGDAGEEDPLEAADGDSSLNWNTKKVPDGRYRIRVVASDAATSPDEPAQAEATSETILVDNTAPRILAQLARRIALAPPAEVPVRDVGTYVASAEYRVDSGEWVVAAAGDGIFDSPEETVRIDLDRLPPGRHAIQIRVRDAAGNEALTKIGYALTRPAAAPPRPSGLAPPRPTR